MREAQLQKIPFMLVMGGREPQYGQVAVRHRKHSDQAARPLPDVIAVGKLIDRKSPSG
jgi:threonyl-tRNA synthetase